LPSGGGDKLLTKKTRFVDCAILSPKNNLHILQRSKMKNYFVLIGIAIMFYVIGCSSDEVLENPTDLEAPLELAAAPLGDDVMFENMYAAEVATLADKTPVHIVTVIEGTGRVTLDARFRGVRDFGLGFPIYECELTDAAAHAMGGIAQGMSGSPVGPPGRIMGALAYAEDFSNTPHRFWVAAIDAMESAMTQQTFDDLLKQHLTPGAPAGKINAAYTPVKTPLMITGIQPHRLQQIASHLKGARYDFIEIFSDVGGTVDAPVHDTSTLAAGDMIGVAMARGDVVNAIGFGTVTQVYEDKFVAFGHPMNGDGGTALPVYRAIVRGLVSKLNISYKSAAAYGKPIGTITKDLTPGIVGQLGVLPEMIPVNIAYQIDNGEIIEKHHEVAYGQEAFIPIVTSITVDTIRQENSPGTVDGTITLRFEETEKTYTRSYRVASEDLLLDTLLNVDGVIYAFTDMIANSTAKATLAEVSVAITETPMVKQAAVHEVIVPETIVPGETATFNIVLLPHWSATQGKARTLQREVTLEIPQNFPVGEAQFRVVTEAGDDVLSSDPFFDFFDDGPTEDTRLPENLDDLIEQMEENQIEKGRITVTLSPAGYDNDFLFNDDILFDGEDISFFDDAELVDPIEKEIIVEGFIITGAKEMNVDIAPSSDQPVSLPTVAVAEIAPASGSQVTGIAVFEQDGEEITLIISIENASPGLHAVHIHENGDCSAPDAISAGGHWNPTGVAHGEWGKGEFHLGDIGNITVGEDGTGILTLTTDLWEIGTGSPVDIVGKGIIVHAGEDDFTTQPSGNAGARIGCGVIIIPE
jgi:Cu-Zn family superoxide dismutase